MRYYSLNTQRYEVAVLTSKYRAKDLLDSLESLYSKRYSILREVTMIDPEANKLYWAYQYGLYPDYYGKSLAKRGEDLENLPIVPADYDPRKSPTVRRIDALMVGGMDSYGEYQKTAVEIKVSRADFKRDTEAKRKPWMNVTNRFVYLVPDGLVTPDEVPAECGLWYWKPYVYNSGGSITIAKKAKIRHSVEDFDSYFESYMIGRASRAEAELRRLKNQIKLTQKAI